MSTSTSSHAAYQAEQATITERYNQAVAKARDSRYPGIIQLSARRYAVVEVTGTACHGSYKAAPDDLQGRLSMQLATGPLAWSSAMAMLYKLRSETQS